LNLKKKIPKTERLKNKSYAYFHAYIFRFLNQVSSSDVVLIDNFVVCQYNVSSGQKKSQGLSFRTFKEQLRKI